MLPAWLIKWVTINPMFGIIESTRGLFYYGTLPDLHSYAYAIVSSTITLFIGLYIFAKADKKFIYFV